MIKKIWDFLSSDTFSIVTMIMVTGVYIYNAVMGNEPDGLQLFFAGFLISAYAAMLFIAWLKRAVQAKIDDHEQAVAERDAKIKALYTHSGE